MENEITLSWHLRSSIESTAGVQSMLDTYIFFSIWFPLVEKKQPYIETKQFFFNKKLAKETSTHLIWNHQFKNLMNLSESILIYIILVTYSFPPPAVNPLPLPLPMLPLEKSTPHLRWLGTFRSGKKDNSAGPKLMAPRSSGSQSLQGMAGIKGSTLATLLKFWEFIEGTCVDIWY